MFDTRSRDTTELKVVTVMLRFKGSNYLRLRLVLSCLTGRPVRIEEIRADDEAPGLHAFEASLLRLVEKVSNGCVVEINETGATSYVLCYQSKPPACLCAQALETNDRADCFRYRTTV